MTATTAYYKTWDGVVVNCLATDSPAYLTMATKSKTDVPWIGTSKYARWTMWYFLGVLGVFIILRMINVASDFRYKRYGRSLTIPLKNRTIAFCRWIGYRHIPLISQTTALPSQLGLLIFIAATFVFLCCVVLTPTYWYRACFGFGSPPVASRAGVVANALTPLVYAFSGKVNIITVLTGVSYEKLNILHGMAAWLSLIFAWIHAIPFLAQPVWELGMKNLTLQYQTNIEYPSGVAAIVLLCVLTFFSLKSLRVRFYELFLIVHWPSAIAYIGVLFWHDANLLESWYYLWASIGVWASGLLYRYFKKTSYLNIRGRWYQAETATIQTLPDTAVEINVFSKTVEPWRPGQHMYVRFLNVQAYGNHPFTICSQPEVDKESGYSRMRFIARPYSGFTKMLYEQAELKKDTQYQVYWDGPYGGLERDIESFDHVFLACSGSGATAVIPHLKNLAIKLASSARVSTKKIHLLWTVRQVGTFDWFRQDIEDVISLLPDPSILDLTVHVTQEEINLELINTHKSVNFLPGRPDVKQWFSTRSADISGRAIAVTAGCEPVRASVSNAVAGLQSLVLKGQADEFYLHSEAFGW